MNQKLRAKQEGGKVVNHGTPGCIRNDPKSRSRGPSLFILLEGFLVEPGPEDGQSCRIFDLVFSPKRSVLIS